MYPGRHATERANQPAIIMAGSGETRTFAEIEARSNKLAHFLRSQGLQRLDHYRDLHGKQRPVRRVLRGRRTRRALLHLHQFVPDSADELAYLVDNCCAKVLITSQAKREVALAGVTKAARRSSCACCRRTGRRRRRCCNLDEAIAALPTTPIADESLGTPMLYSSGTTGRPKGIIRPLPEQPPSQPLPLFDFLMKLWRYREGMTYLSPAPLYHSAPQAAVALAMRHGATTIVMERFDPEDYLRLVEKAPRHAFAARADDVFAHAETAARRAQEIRSVVARDRRSTPLRRVRRRSRSR